MTGKRKCGLVARSARWLAATLALAACGCYDRPQPAEQPEKAVSTEEAESAKPAKAPRLIRVAAASDLQSALPELVRQFTKENPGIAVDTTFGSSGKLAEQIKAGAPFDLFMAANESFVKGLADEKVVRPESVKPYAVGSLVMAVRSDAPEPIGAIEEILKPGVKRIAVANPDFAPYGAAARQALKSAGLWEKVEAKLVLAESVRQAFQFAETGNADVAFVGRALVRGSDLKVIEVDPSLYEPIVQGLGVVAASKQGAEAQAFADYVAGPRGQSLLKTFGFNSPAEPRAAAQ